MTTTRKFTCTLCLEAFQKPKLLPCFHTFCEDCLRKLATKHGGKRFPCPLCRTNVSVPTTGGVSAFQTNFYIDRPPSCTSHPSNDIVSFCSTCDNTICVECMLEGHKLHDVKTIAKAAASSREQLSDDQKRLVDIKSTVQKRLDKAKENHKFQQEKFGELRTEIQTRCAQLVSSAEAHRDAELAKLDLFESKLERKGESEVVKGLQEAMNGPLSKIQREIQETLKEGDYLQLISLGIELRTGKRSVQAIDASIPQCPQYFIKYPTLCKENHPCATSAGAIIGSFSIKHKLLSLDLDCPLSPVVLCPRQDVYSFVVLGDGDVCVSYEQADAPLQRFNKDGVLVDAKSGLKGKIILHDSEGAECLFIVPESGKELFLAKRHPVVLQRGLDRRQCTVKKIDIKSKQTWTSEWTQTASINCSAEARLVSFDTNEDKAKFAVLQESKDGEDAHSTTYCLNVYLNNNQKARFTWSLKALRPTDVCFFVDANGKEVLLVADEKSASVYSLDINQDSPLNPVIPGNGVLLQPMALRQDKLGRLWIACRDGHIFLSP